MKEPIKPSAAFLHHFQKGLNHVTNPNQNKAFRFIGIISFYNFGGLTGRKTVTKNKTT